MARKKVQPEEQMDTALDTGLDTGETEAIEESPMTALPDAEPPVLLLPDDTGDEGGTTESDAEPAATEAAPEEKPKRKRSTKTKKDDDASQKEPEASDDTEDDMAVDEPPRRNPQKRILTIEAGDIIESPEEQDEIAWHEIQNAYRSKRILTGTLGGVEKTKAKTNVCIIYYKNIRVTIPYSEMMIKLPEDAQSDYGNAKERTDKIINNMLGADIDFIVHGIDKPTRAVVASRKSAMLKKRERYYFRKDATTGLAQVHEGRIVQARVIATTPVTIRADVFGIEISVRAADLSWDWIGDVTEKYYVGDKILLRIQEIKGDSPETLSVKADGKSVYPDTARNNLSKCTIQGKYVGTVTNVNKGAVYIQLANGVNAVAHTCFDPRMPGRKDDVGFVVTHIDTTHNLAVGIITRIIKQNL